MTTASFAPHSISLLSSAPASPVPKSLLSSRTGVAFPARPFGSLIHLRTPVMASIGVRGNGSPAAPEDSAVSPRFGEVKRVTKETNVHVKINLDGTGLVDCSTGIPFLDHMLDQLSSHGLFDVYVKATGDTHIDDHHSNEDIALAIGTALLQALGDRKGINRFGHFTAPLDEAAVEVILDLSGRPHLSCGLSIPSERVGTYDTQLVEHFFQTIVNTFGMTLHIRQLAGKNSHHIIEASFKAFARALRQATEYDLRRHGTILSSKAYAEMRLVGDKASLQNMEREDRIKKQLLEPEVSPSPYDTAWVAMVPLQGSSPHTPCFPQCVEWILRNQQDNGSWGIKEFGSPANKDIILSTLACVLALKKWNVGREHIWRGLHFIGRNFSIALDEQIASPIGFNTTFPGMLSLAIRMGLEFPVRQRDIDVILHLWDIEFKRQAGDKSYGRKAYMAYVAEGFGNLLDWNEVMKFQRKNGSLFNSPATTAAALVYNYDDRALEYLNLLVSKFSSAVPTVYPLNMHCQLSMVDSLEKIGISQHFSSEIKGILDMAYGLWLQRDEEIMLDVATCAMAFRLLRMNGYDVSSDELSHVAEASIFHNSMQGYLNDTKSLLELYKASKVCLSDNESILDNIGYWSGSLLTEKLCSDGLQRIPIFGEMEYTLKFPFYTTLERLDHKRNIEHFDVRSSQMLKTLYSPSCVNQDLLDLAVEDFTFSQSIYQDELLDLDSWVRENRLDQLQFARQKLTYCYLSAAATIFPPELSDARISWAKNGVLTTVVDDFFDVGGSKEELENLIALVEKWDKHHKDDFYSEQVQIVFCALYTTVNQLGSMASAVQERDIRNHLIEIWLHLLRSMMTEAEWQRSQYVPTVEEYMTNGVISFALGPIVLPALYFVGEKLSEHVVDEQEYNELFRLMSTCGRLLNDSQGFEREGSEGKLNSISLLVLHSGGSMSIDAAKKVMQKSIVACRRDLLRLLVLREDSAVPRPCKELFWKMCKILHLFYFRTDGFSSPKEMASAVNAVINEPLQLPSYSKSCPSTF